MTMAQPEIRQPKFKEGDKVQKVSGYRYPGVIRKVVFNSEDETRYVVECIVEDCRKMLHIFNEAQLKLLPVGWKSAAEKLAIAVQALKRIIENDVQSSMGDAYGIAEEAFEYIDKEYIRGKQLSNWGAKLGKGVCLHDVMSPFNDACPQCQMTREQINAETRRKINAVQGNTAKDIEP